MKNRRRYANFVIHSAIEAARVPKWRIADKFGISDGNFSKLLRKELNQEQTNRIMEIIRELSQNEGI